MERPPLVSIIVPFHNRKELLVETLESVLKQSFTDWECILVNDRSNADVMDFIQQYTNCDSRFRIVSMPTSKKYVSAARNFGLEVALGKYINFLDSDDLLLPNKIQKQVDLFLNFPEFEMVTCQFATLSEHDGMIVISERKFAPSSHWLDVAWRTDYFERYGGLWCTNSSLWRKDSILSLGAWNETLNAWHDVELNIRAMVRGVKIARIEEVLVYIRDGNRDRMSAPSIARAKSIGEAMLVAWSELKKHGKVTLLRKKMITVQSYGLARMHLKKGTLLSACVYWIWISFQIKQSWKIIFIGLVLLLGSNFYSLKSLCQYLQPQIDSVLNILPDAVNTAQKTSTLTCDL